MEYLATLDDKGRISLPARIRGTIKDNSIILTKGMNTGVWLFTLEEWDDFYKRNLAASQVLSVAKQLRVQHQLFAPKAEIEIDKTGRIAVPQSLRDYASLSRDCKILELSNHLEIWDSELYKAYEKATAEQLQAILEEMGPASIVGGHPS